MSILLVVDDNEENLILIKRLLHHKGYSIKEATNGLKAIEQVIRYQPNLILMDLRMPYMDGWEATRRIKARLSSKHIPIIAVSAYIGKDDVYELYNAGFSDYITKPIDVRSNILPDKVSKYLS